MALQKVYKAVEFVLNNHLDEYGYYGNFSLENYLDFDDTPEDERTFKHTGETITDTICGQVLSQDFPHASLLESLGYTIVELESEGGGEGGGDTYTQTLIIMPKELFNGFKEIESDVIKVVDFVNDNGLSVVVFRTWYASYNGIGWDDGELKECKLDWEPAYVTE